MKGDIVHISLDSISNPFFGIHKFFPSARVSICARIAPDSCDVDTLGDIKASLGYWSAKHFGGCSIREDIGVWERNASSNEVLYAGDIQTDRSICYQVSVYPYQKQAVITLIRKVVSTVRAVHGAQSPNWIHIESAFSFAAHQKI